MKCPFLREARVKSCEASPYRKRILEATSDADHERCSSPSWHTCAAAAATPGAGESDSPRCPYLREEHAEFCDAAPVRTYIPATSALSSRCNSDGHLYCENFMRRADPAGDRLPGHHGSGDPGTIETPLVDGLPVPTHLSYSPNHMWLDVSADGQVHVGIDAFLAWVIGQADEIRFVAPRPSGLPLAVITVAGVDLPMEFPERIHASVPNAYLRTRPERLTEDPYGAGWLFEGMDSRRATDGTAEEHSTLLDGHAAPDWIRFEMARLNDFVHERVVRADPSGVSYVADGGTAEKGMARLLDRDSQHVLFDELFSSRRSW